jgi:CheY-like chemotaxis protein
LNGSRIDGAPDPSDVQNFDLFARCPSGFSRHPVYPELSESPSGVPMFRSVSNRGADLKGERLRIVVADDHPSTRENLRYLLNAEPDLEVVGAARNGVEALRLIQELRPDVAVLDRQMPLLDGLQVAAQLRREKLRVRIVLFTLDADVFGPLADGVVVTKDAPAAVLLAAVRGPRAQPAVRAAQPLRVLVVEDDECTRDALVQFLSDEGFSVESALDGQEALGVAAGGGLDIIVLDLMLPVLDGAAFADIWRTRPGGERVPIVAMSGLPHGDVIAAEFGAAAFRSKPVDLAALADLLRTTAGQSEPGAAVRDS